MTTPKEDARPPAPAGVDRDDWDRHWDQFNDIAENNPAQHYRREMILASLGVNGTGQGARILDIGSGQGDMASVVRLRFPASSITGLELSSSGVAISRGKVPTAQFLQCNLLEEAEPPDSLRGWATHAICSEVLEHLDRPDVLLKNAAPYMAEGCRLVVTVPGGPMSAFDKHIGHRKHWRADELAGLMRDAGYATERATGVGFPFFNLYRCVVILRGEHLVDDVSGPARRSASLPARLAMSAFRALVRPAFNSSRSGWQVIATGRLASRPS